MIFSIVRTALISLRRDRGALALSFVLPIVFFSIFAVIFGGRRDTTAKIALIVVDEDHSTASRRLIKGLQGESSLSIQTRSTQKGGVEDPEYSAATAEAAVKRGVVPLALVIPHGFGENPLSFGPAANRATIQLLEDPSNPVAAQMVYGLLQKVAMTSMPDAMFEQGYKQMDQLIGGFTPLQRRRVQEELDQIRQWENQPDAVGGKNPVSAASETPVAVSTRDVVAENKKGALVSFYAAAIGVMFLLFTASGASGSLLDEVESGTLDRILSTRVTMTTLLAGKLVFCTLLAFSQLLLMFLWAWLVFKLDFFDHIAGFCIMGLATAFAVGAFGMLLATVCRTRAQLGALSTLVILIMSSVGGSMFPRFLMPEGMQKAGLLTINAWAIDGFTKIFWRDEPVVHLWPEVLVLLATGVLLFIVARRLAKRWEYV